MNIRNSAIVSDEYKDYGFLVCMAYNYHYLAEDEQIYETGETVIEHCSVSHSSITVKLPEPDADETEPAVTTMEVVPPDVIEYDEEGNIIEPEEDRLNQQNTRSIASVQSRASVVRSTDAM